jgi:CcmD family protein
MTAYALAWTAILIYMWSIWQRLNRVQREIADVNRRVEAGARR